MEKNEKSFYDDILKSADLEQDIDKKLLIIYEVLSDKVQKQKLDKNQRRELFKHIKAAVEQNENEVVAGWYFLGDCYHHGYGCKKSDDDAIACLNMILEKKGDYAKDWICKAHSKLGHIYMGWGNYKEAQKHIHMTTNPRDFEKLADYLWVKKSERAALEDYKKAGELGRIKTYKKVVEKCLKSSDSSIKEKAEEFAGYFFRTDADKKQKQIVADKMMDYYYKSIRNVTDTQEKNKLEDRFDRFKHILDDNGLKKKNESRLIKAANNSYVQSVGGLVVVPLALKQASNIVKKIIK